MIVNQLERSGRNCAMQKACFSLLHPHQCHYQLVLRHGEYPTTSRFQIDPICANFCSPANSVTPPTPSSNIVGHFLYKFTKPNPTPPSLLFNCSIVRILFRYFLYYQIFLTFAWTVHARYTGTGHADLTKWEWATHQHRDTLSSIVGHATLTSYLAVADGESIGRIRFEMAEVRLNYVGTATLT